VFESQLIFIAVWLFEQKVLGYFLLFQGAYDLNKIHVYRSKYQASERKMIQVVKKEILAYFAIFLTLTIMTIYQAVVIKHAYSDIKVTGDEEKRQELVYRGEMAVTTRAMVFSIFCVLVMLLMGYQTLSTTRHYFYYLYTHHNY
jgi:uncharacterized membrane protein YjgN (DUF898 family)